MKAIKVSIILTLVLIALAVALITFVCEDGWCYIFPWQGDRQTACTMEARLCPDGSAVGRAGPNCEFSPCP